MKKRFFDLRLDEEEAVADLYIFGDIVAYEWFENDVSSYTLAKKLQELQADVINVHINSYGGEVAEGLAIYNSLKNHPAEVRTYCDGFACSAASVVFMAGDKRVMNPASLLMIHNAWTYASGNAKELRKAADDLETISETSAAAYRSCVNISDEELAELLDNETWITPAEALDWGFATAIQTDTAASAPSMSAKKAVFAALTKRAPAEAGPTEEPPEAEPGRSLSAFLSALRGGKE